MTNRHFSAQQEQQLHTQLQTLHLAAIAACYRPLAQDAAQQRWSYEGYLATLIETEVDRRTGTRRQRRIQEARFPLSKELADFDFDQIPALNKAMILALAQGTYLAQASSVLLVGGAGLGKTHLAIALGLAACRQDHRVRFYTVTELVNALHQAQDEHRLPKFLETALRHKLIILDELGYVPFTPTGAQLLFQFCSALHERVALLVTTNLPFGEWVQVLGDARLTVGLLDRLTANAYILEFVGESYRFRRGLAQQASQTAAGPLRNTRNAGEAL